MSDSTVSFAAVVPAVASSARLLRRFLAHCLLMVDSETSEADAALVLSELVTNAIEYGQVSSLRVALLLSGDSLVIEVRDDNTDPPVPPVDGVVAAERGHGLHIVDALSDRWGWRPADRGKTVWAELAARPASRAYEADTVGGALESQDG